MVNALKELQRFLEEHYDTVDGEGACDAPSGNDWMKAGRLLEAVKKEQVNALSEAKSELHECFESATVLNADANKWMLKANELCSYAEQLRAALEFGLPILDKFDPMSAAKARKALYPLSPQMNTEPSARSAAASGEGLSPAAASTQAVGSVPPASKEREPCPDCGTPMIFLGRDRSGPDYTCPKCCRPEAPAVNNLPKED